ncbi:MAG: ribonuclease J [Holosporales bacterium]|jgi:ribonuclease J|nr:ribonuclease J [Holosporales bacterium]
MLAKKDEILILPLGGLEQIGVNSTMIGHNNDWIMVDLGISFYDKYGIEVLTPDITFPVSVRKNIRALFITHAHEDHMGAIPYLWEQLRIPIYATEFPAAVLLQKFKEYEWKNKVEMHIVKQNEPFNVGEFEIEYIPLAHSTIGSSGIYIKTASGNIFCTGDWKIDEKPLLGDKIDVKKMEKIGKTGVDCLLCDSTNILVNENIGSETDVRNAIVKIFKENKAKRITVTCFASNLTRMESVFKAARDSGRKVAIIGRSMHKMCEAISKTAYYTNDFKNGISLLVNEREAVDMPFEKVVFLCTGSQGESRSALFKIARGENQTIKFGKHDLVVFSSKVIPGNELVIRNLQNLLVKKNVEIITTDIEANIHVSGHPNREDIAMMYKWLKPRSLIPIHGDTYMLYAHEKFARERGITERIIAESGDVISLKAGKLNKIGKKTTGINCIDGNYIIPLNSPFIKERADMACNGHISVSFVISSRDGTLSGSPDVVIDGIYKDPETKLEMLIYQAVSNDVKKNHSGVTENLKNEIKDSVRRIFSKYHDKKPIVSVHIHVC